MNKGSCPLIWKRVTLASVINAFLRDRNLGRLNFYEASSALERDNDEFFIQCPRNRAKRAKKLSVDPPIKRL